MTVELRQPTSTSTFTNMYCLIHVVATSYIFILDIVQSGGKNQYIAEASRTPAAEDQQVVERDTVNTSKHQHDQVNMTSEPQRFDKVLQSNLSCETVDQLP